jgi:hypothetical protein
MASCYNKNTSEYKALQDIYESPIVVDSIISSWQKSSKSDIIPTVFQAEKYLEQQQTMNSLKKREYKDALLANLSRKKLMSKYEGSYYVNNTNQKTLMLDRELLYKNKKRIEDLLGYWNVPRESIIISPTDKSFKVTVDENIFKNSDILPEKINKNETHILDIVQHLNSMFPQLTVSIATVKEAREYYDSLPEWQKSKVPFEKINSYYVNGQAVLIKGRVTKETAVEEVLHPFVDSIYNENRQLFKGLLSEARSMFPELTQQINDSYTDQRGFNQIHRDLELVTQSLSRHFNKEYENEPTQKWYQKVAQLLKYFLDVVKDLFTSLTGGPLKLKTNMIKSNTTLSDLAKLLNTEELQFEFTGESVVDRKVRFSLTPEKQAAVKEYQTMGNDVQKDLIAQLFHAATEKNQEFHDFTVGSPLTGSDTPLVILDKEKHEYVDVESGELYKSTTTKIKGGLKDEQNLYKLNRDIGNDFDAIMEHLAQFKPIDQLPKMNVLNKAQIQRAIDQIQTVLTMYRAQGAVIIPQVVIADGASSTAGTIDLLAVHQDGTLQVIDLKVSKNSINSSMYLKPYPVNEGSVFYDPQVSGENQFKMSTRMQQSMQVNTYKRILENMGYELRQDSQTIHFLVEVVGQGKKQKFTGKFEFEGQYTHKGQDNASYINEIVPVNVDANFAEKIANQNHDNGGPIETPLNQEEELPQDDTLDDDTYKAVYNTVLDFKEKILTRKEALEMLQDRVKQSANSQRILKDIDAAVALINLSVTQGTADVAYEELLKLALNETDNFIEYATDPKNYGSPEYINRVLNFESLANTLSALDEIDEQDGKPIKLNMRQSALKNKLASQLRKVLGSKSKNTEGIINESVQNYVRQFIVDNSNRNFTKNELDQVMKEADDIGIGEFFTGDMATNKDVLLQLMDKLYKSNKQKVLDLVENRNDQIRRVLNKLEALSPRGKVDYSFMLQYDKDGNFTGRYIKEIGYKYWGTRYDIRKDLYEEDGTWKEYIVKDNYEDYTEAEKKYNQDLYYARQKNREFNQAEKKVGNNYKDGDYHKYTQEFKTERDKFEEWVPSGRFGYWKKRGRVSQQAYQAYKIKYYQTVEVSFANFDRNNSMNGTLQQPTTIEVVKSKFKEIKPVATINGEMVDMRDRKYLDIMEPNPTDSLAQVQKEFYEMFIKFYEKDLLEKLPSSVRNQMYGMTPIIKDNAIKSAKGQGSTLTNLWGSSVRSFKNFWQTTSDLQKVVVDENGQFVDTLPIYFVGNTRSENALKSIDQKLNQLLKDYNQGNIDEVEYKLQEGKLKGSRQRLQNQPSLQELSTDMGDNLLRFSAMAENYEVMNEVSDTLNAMMKVIENRSYNPSSTSKKVAYVRGKMVNVGLGKNNSGDSLMVRRARKWMKMVYWDNDKRTRQWYDKVSAGLIQLSSATYVGFNVFGNINNYAVGRINNGIEVAGARYFDREAYLRASKVFQVSAMTDMIKKTADSSTWAGLTGGRGKYKKYIPGHKYNALVEHFRMMDDKADLREQNRAKGKESKFREALSWGYLLQDGAEYNVQTKVGVAILMTRRVRNAAGEEMSLYDAYQYNSKTGELTMKEGFDQIVDFVPGQPNAVTPETGTQEFNDQKRYNIRNYIREVNKQIHGNYAREDRTVMQQWWLGNLAMQFHKWVAPAMKARFRGEYFDENLGWMEGRYKSAWSFMAFAMKNVKDYGSINEKFKDQYGDKAFNKIAGAKRTAADLAFMIASFMMAGILESLFDDDDDDKSRTRKRFENALMYQMRRQARELMFFLPFFGFKEQYMMAKSPISATRTVGELAEALSQSFWFPAMSIYDASNPNYDIRKDKDYYYQRGTRKGQSKFKKEWGDVIPIIYTFNRWAAYDTAKDWWVK